MKLVYIISLGHSGSTLADCILGTHPDFISSGELRYLNWQLKRTENIRPSVSAQNVCTCERGFQDCPYWSKVFAALKQKTGKDIVSDPTSFDTAYFNQFAYQDRNGFTRSYVDKVKAYLTREWCEQGWKYNNLYGLSPQIDGWLKNNWVLYETMTEVGGRQVVVDSSKHLMIALLLQQYKPGDVTILFLHRSLEALVASEKRRAIKKGIPQNVKKVVKAKCAFEKRVKKYKNKIKNLQFLEVSYKEMVTQPASFLEKVVAHIGARTNYEKQSNSSFFIDPSQQHLVAGNPMRYRGRQKVEYDDRWERDLKEDDKNFIKKIEQLS